MLIIIIIVIIVFLLLLLLSLYVFFFTDIIKVTNHRSEIHRRSQDFVWGAFFYFFPQKVDDLF